MSPRREYGRHREERTAKMSASASGNTGHQFNQFNSAIQFTSSPARNTTSWFGSVPAGPSATATAIVSAITKNQVRTTGRSDPHDENRCPQPSGDFSTGSSLPVTRLVHERVLP